MVLKCAAMAAVLLGTGPAMAGWPLFGAVPHPVCANPDVLDFVTRDVQLRDPYATIDARTVRELPAGFEDGDKACEATIRSVLYHQPPYPGPVPMAAVTRYEVRTLPDGFVVTPLP